MWRRKPTSDGDVSPGPRVRTASIEKLTRDQQGGESLARAECGSATPHISDMFGVLGFFCFFVFLMQKDKENHLFFI